MKPILSNVNVNYNVIDKMVDEYNLKEIRIKRKKLHG